jgi:hypothetical protein
VIADHHQCALVKSHINPARGVRQDQILDTEQLKGPNRESNFFQRIAFVIMNAALHRQNRHAVNIADHECAGMALRCRRDEARDVAVRNANCIFELIGKTAETTSQHQRHIRRRGHTRTYDSCCGFSAGIEVSFGHLFRHLK